MNNVYLDLLFIINFITDYITLLCTARISNACIRRKWIALASVFGGLYACFCMIYHDHWINQPPVQFACAVLLCFISFHTEDHLLRCCITFIIISSIFGGILSPFVFDSQQGKYLSINAKALILTFAAVYFLLSHLYHRSDKQMSQIYHQAEISLLNEKITLTVLRDTGNELYDPISNLPVLIIEKKILKNLIPELNEVNHEEDVYDTFCRLNSIPLLSGRFRLIPYQSITGKDILLGFIPDSIHINGKTTEMVVAFTNNKLSTNNQYQGIC